MINHRRNRSWQNQLSRKRQGQSPLPQGAGTKQMLTRHLAALAQWRLLPLRRPRNSWLTHHSTGRYAMKLRSLYEFKR